MLKIFAPKMVNRVNIGYIGNVKIAQELNQAKGVMNNYLKDKKFSVTFVDSFDKDFVHAQSLDDKKTSCSYIAIKKDGDTPFLRNIYKALEKFAKDKNINKE